MIDEPAPEFASTTAVVLGSAVPRKVGLKKYREKWLLLFFCSLPTSDEDCDVEMVVARRVELEKKYGCRVLGVASGFTVEEITLWVRRRNNGKNSAGKQQHFRSLGAADVCIISDADYSIARQYGLPIRPSTNSGEAMREAAQGMFLLSPDGLVKYRSLIGSAEKNIEEHLMLLQTYSLADSSSGERYQRQSGSAQQQTVGDVRSYVYSMRATTHSMEDVELPSDRFTAESADLTAEHGSGIVKAMLEVGKWYQQQLKESPVVTKAVTSCLIGLLGEVIGATINRIYASRRGDLGTAVGDGGFWRSVLNRRRLAVFGLYGLLVTGPFFHWWYGFLENLVRNSKLTSAHASFLLKLGLNQLVMTPPFLLFTLSYINFFLSFSSSNTVQAVKRTYAAALFTNWKVWTVAQAINFQLVPLDYRVLFGNMVALWWNIYLSIVSNASG